MLSFFFPLYLVRFDIAGMPLYLIEALVLIAAIPVFYNLIRGEHEVLEKGMVSKILYLAKSPFLAKKHPVKEFVFSPLFPITLFVAGALIGAAIVPVDSYKHALGILKSWVLIPLIYFFIVYRTIRTKSDIQLVIYSYIASAFLLSIIAVFQAVSGNYLTIDNRASGPFASANYLAMYIAPALIYTGVRVLQTFLHRPFETASTRWNYFERRIYLSGIVSVLFLTLILTQSYGGIIGVFFTFFFYIVYERIRQRAHKPIRIFLNKVITFIAVIVVLGGALVATLNIEKFQNLIRPGEHTSLGTRLEIWEVGGKLLTQNPLLGIGLGEYEALYKEHAESLLGHVPFESVRLHSHNMYLETWLNTGLIGIIAFMWILIMAFYHVKKTIPLLQRDERHIMLAISMMLIYVMVHGMVDVPFWKNDLSLMFWMIIGTLFAVTPHLKQS
ncbi:hypothetical protein GF369_04265 [Candidatus Peregrinibacteria bacterium]|nr:hypothetical protein [Candidatus Peregrinibacteria bacterium]